MCVDIYVGKVSNAKSNWHDDLDDIMMSAPHCIAYKRSKRGTASSGCASFYLFPQLHQIIITFPTHIKPKKILQLVL